MTPEQIAICDEHLPGRDPAEDKALSPFLRRIESAERKLTAMSREERSTEAGLDRKIDRMLEKNADIDDAHEALITELKRLAAVRGEMLPVDAEEVEHVGRAEHDHTMDRYKVIARTPSGTVQLGGCADLNCGEERARWFQALLESRRRATR